MLYTLKIKIVWKFFFWQCTLSLFSLDCSQDLLSWILHISQLFDWLWPTILIRLDCCFVPYERVSCSMSVAKVWRWVFLDVYELHASYADCVTVWIYISGNLEYSLLHNIFFVDGWTWSNSIYAWFVKSEFDMSPFWTPLCFWFLVISTGYTITAVLQTSGP